MDIVSQNDRARAGFFQNSAANDIRTRIFPIERIDFPQDNFVTELVVNETFLVRGYGAVGRTK